MTTTLSSNGQVAIPDELRELDHLQAGDDFHVRRTAPGRYVLEKVQRVESHAARRSSRYGHDVLVAPAGAPPLTPELVKELLDEA